MDDRAAFVTGGAGGIGRATCQAFHDAGYRVALTDLDADVAGLRQPRSTPRASAWSGSRATSPRRRRSTPR